MKNKENWNKWYQKNKSTLIKKFGGFIIDTKIGDMDLNTYCRYCFFVYQNEDKLKKTYQDNLKKEGNRFLKDFENEEFYRLAIFYQVEVSDKFTEQALA